MVLFLFALIGMLAIPAAPWLGGVILAACAYASSWMWDGTSEWVEIVFASAAALSVIGAFAGVV